MSGHNKPFKQLYKKVAQSVVSIYTHGTEPGPSGGTGSGFVYDRHHIVTNQHVVSDVKRAEVRFSDGAWRNGSITGTDAYTDLAVIRIEDLPNGVEPLAVAAESPAPGEPVAAFGNPMGLEGTVSTGIVSGVNRSMRTDDGFAIPDTVQTDAPINPGNSGGPLVTLDGTVVGVNRARTGDNIGFAISPAIVARVVPELIQQGQAQHATLHIATMDVSPTVAEANGVAAEGVLVVSVGEGPARGILSGCTGKRRVHGQNVPVGGDIIHGINGHQLHSQEELVRYLITNCQPEETIELHLRRSGKETITQVRLADRNAV